MYVQPVMIYVDYNHKGDLAKDGTLQIDGVQIFEQIAYDSENETWYTFNHFRRFITDAAGKVKERMLQIGFVIQGENMDDINVSIISADNNQQALTYCKQHNVWFELATFRNKAKGSNYYRYHHTKRVAGISEAGKLNFVVRNREQEVTRGAVSFLPSSISVEDYEWMLNDLYRIHDGLFADKRKITVGKKQAKQHEYLQKMLDQLHGPLNAINEIPHEHLSFQWLNDKPGRQEKFRLRTEMDKQLKSGKHKVRVYKALSTPNIMEHQIIKSELIRLYNYCQFYSDASFIKKDTEQIHHDIDIKLSQASRNIQNLYQQKPIKTPFISLTELAAMKQEVQNKFNRINEIIKKDIAQEIDQLKRIIDIDCANTIDISITLTLRKTFIYQTVSLNNLVFENVVNSGIDENNHSTLTLDEYRYRAGNRVIIVDDIKSFYVNLQCKGRDIGNHWQLIAAFERATEKLNSKEDYVKITIEGKIISPQDNWRNDSDILGINSANGRNRDYELIFKHIDKVIIDTDQLPLPVDEEKMYLDLASRIYLRKNTSLAKMRISQRENLITDLKLLNKLTAETNLAEEKLEVSNQFKKMQAQIKEWLQLPVFKRVNSTGSERLIPTQLFLHDPKYQKIWRIFQETHEGVDLSLIPEVQSGQYGVKSVDEIYEIWLFYKMIYILTEKMGWTLGETREIKTAIRNFLASSKQKKLSRMQVDLFHNDWKIELHYEPYIKVIPRDEERKSNNRQPDYALKIYRKERCLGIVYADAKYRNYSAQNELEWKADMDIAMKRYGEIEPTEEKWQHPVIASFIFHSDFVFTRGNELNGVNYHIYYHPAFNLAEDETVSIFTQKEKAHKYGAISLLPSYTFGFQNWLRMIMEFRLGKYDYCWTCGTENINVEPKTTRSNFLKYHYTCQKCQEFWVKTHCKKGHTLIKHFNNYHKQVEVQNNWHIECPICSDNFIKKMIEKYAGEDVM